MKRNIENLTARTFDAVIVGGGIYGACIAWDATLRGLSVALLEQGDFGQATSANSQKTVHGGLRYLQHADFKRMRESIRERTTLMRIAPHLVHPLPCIMPTYGNGLKGPYLLAIALKINDIISYDRNRIGDPQKHLPAGRVISRNECLQRLPGIRKEDLTGGALWYDCQMYDSERLTLAFARSAAEHGATLANYVKATGFLQEENRIIGVKATDRLSGAQFSICGRAVINAAGPWVDKVLETIGRTQDRAKLGVRLAKAVNIATRPLFKHYGAGLSGGNGTASKENRLFFITPWRNQSLIGTTYTPHDASPNALRVTLEDVKTLLDCINSIYPPAKLSLDDVLHVYAGLVPASQLDQKAGTAKRAQHYQIRDHGQDGLVGLISVLGVKYTTARDVAEKVVDQLLTTIGQSPRPSHSDTHPLYGGDIEQFDTFLETAVKADPCSLGKSAVRALVYSYGTAFPQVLDYYTPAPPASNATCAVALQSDALLRAQIDYAVQHEMACTLSDIIFRRSQIGASGYPGDQTLDFCASVLAERLGWSSARIAEEKSNVREQFMPLLAWQEEAKK